MKKNNLILSCLVSLLIASCGVDNSTIDDSSIHDISQSSNVIGESPVFKGNRDFIFALDEQAIPLVVSKYDFIAKTTANDKEDGDLTSKITFSVYNYYTKEEVNVIDLSIDGKYILNYYVEDSNGNKTVERNYIIVGDPVANLDENGNLKAFPNITESEYEKISSTYKLVFDEDYNYTGAPGTVENENDYNGYTYQLGGGGWGNNEVQIYEKNERTCYVSDGKLKISVVKDGDTYYSARLNTSNALSKDWTYGKYEVIAKVPQAQGPWPAIWMMPNDYYHYGAWPKCGEIDIMETSYLFLGKILGTVHVNNFNGMNGKQKGSSILCNTIDSEYHKYSIEWLPDRIAFYFDDKKYFTYQPKYYLSSESEKITTDIWPFDYSFHFIFNIAMGGNMGGAISPTLFEKNNEIAMYIDKVSVYQSTYVNEKYLKK